MPGPHIVSNNTQAGSSASTSSFKTIQPDAGTSPVATSPNDTLTLTSSDGSVTITGNAGTDTVNFQVANPGVDTINSDGTAAQTLTVGTTGTDFAIVDNGTGDHKFNLPTASATNRGALSTTDWSTFNAKQAAGSYITALTGDVTASGPGSVASTVAKIQTTTVSGTTGSGNVVFSASPTLTGTAVIASATVSGSLKSGNYHLEPGITANGNSGSSITIDLSTANFQTVTMTANCTFTFSNPQTGGLYVLQLLEDGTGNWVATWPASFKWFGSAITQLSPASKMDMFTLAWDGTNYWVTAAMNGG